MVYGKFQIVYVVDECLEAHEDPQTIRNYHEE